MQWVQEEMLRTNTISNNQVTPSNTFVTIPLEQDVIARDVNGCTFATAVGATQ
jgi:hypothetical protein